MAASSPSVEIDSRPSGPTLDLHTDAIILREGPGAVCSTYLRGSSSCPTVTPTVTPTPTPTTTSVSVSIATPTSFEPSPFLVRRTAFRAAPTIITVGPSPATRRVRQREDAARAQAARGAVLARVEGAAAAARRTASASALGGGSSPWLVLAAFAIGAAMAASAQLIADRGLELAALAAVVAGVMTLAAAFPGKSRARKGERGGH